MRMTPSRAVAGAALAAGLALLAGCGAAAPAAGTPAATAKTPTAAVSAGHSGKAPAGKRPFQANPAIQAAGEIILVAPVVPFSHKQVQTLVPMLQALAKNPKLSSSALDAKAKALLAVLTKQQLEAVHNMQKAHYTGPGATSGGAGAGHFGRGGAAGAGGAGAPAGAKGAKGAKGRGFNPGLIFTRAVAVLQGKVTGGFGAAGGGATGTTGTTGA